MDIKECLKNKTIAKKINKNIKMNYEQAVKETRRTLSGLDGNEIDKSWSDTHDHIVGYNNTVLEALQIADKLMQEPTYSMVYKASQSEEFNLDAKTCGKLWLAMRDQMIKEIKKDE